MRGEEAKPLSLKQAQRCEDACEPVCKCRCGGAAHGKGRGSGQSFFESLPPDDTHYVPSAQIRARQRAERAAAKKREHDEKMRRRYEALSQMRRGFHD